VNVWRHDLVQSSLWGLARGAFVHSIVFPLDVVKVRYQTEVLPSVPKITELYRGYLVQLIKISVKQAWSWPMITQMPNYLKKQGLPVYTRELVTGLSIASLDALFTTPLEKLKVQQITAQTTSYFFKEGWKGCFYHWKKLSVGWPTFLISQKYFREKSETKSMSSMALIGAKVALVVSLMQAPFDLQSSRALLGKEVAFCGWISSFRGWPFSALSLMIHNIFSVMLIETLENQQRRRNGV
jgi:hypothetical protein